MSRSKSLVLVFSSLCALAACARIPDRSTTRHPAQRTQRVVMPEPMGNPSATVQDEPRVDPVDDRRLMEPDWDTEPSQAAIEPSYDRAMIQNLEDPSASVEPIVAEKRETVPAPAPAVDPNDELIKRKPTAPIEQPNPDEVIGPGSH